MRYTASKEETYSRLDRDFDKLTEHQTEAWFVLEQKRLCARVGHTISQLKETQCFIIPDNLDVRLVARCVRRYERATNTFHVVTDEVKGNRIFVHRVSEEVADEYAFNRVDEMHGPVTA